MTIPVAEQAKPRKIEIQRGEVSAVGSHEGHKMISGDGGADQASTDHEPAAGAR